jgi:RimJ/RimL family protein N-acetyltransferase
VTRADRATAQPSTYLFPDELRIDELLIRPPVDADVEAIAPAFVDPAVGGEASMPPFDEQMLRWALQNQIPELKARGVLSPYVIADTATEAILGGLTLHHFDPLRDGIEVGYWLFVSARGRGVATRAVRAAVEHGFANGIYRVEAHVRIGNAASERVLERLGFQREGVKRRFLRHGEDDQRYDATLFALLADD